MAIKFTKPFTTILRDDAGKRLCTLLWGDPVHVLDETADPWRVKARAQTGRLASSELSDSGLLEIYVIDVGQGDGVLLKTPEGKWHLIDAGVANRSQMTKKGAANFLRWKFQEDLLQPAVTVENVIVTHPDYDHYGGLLDLFAGRLFDGRTFPISVESFYHPGMARFAVAPALGGFEQGEVAPFPNGSHGLRRKDRFINELLNDKNSFANPPRPLDGAFAELAALVTQVPKNVRRLSHHDGHLPGYAPGQGPVAIRVLGPILEEFAPGKYGLRQLASESITRNGHSIVLRLDYGQARILLTGDLNEESQRLLLSYQPAGEFAADVTKGCHHGSEDINLEFIKAIAARATVVSSGDNEDYSHPRPVVLGASGRYGREGVDASGDQLPPLIYSTELARSVRLANAAAVRVKLADSEVKVSAAQTRIRSDEDDAKYVDLTRTPIAMDLVYGLVNVRTDGQHILCATMEEKGDDFDVKVFQAGVDAPGN